MGDVFAAIRLLFALSGVVAMAAVAMAWLRVEIEDASEVSVPRLDHECDVMGGAEDVGDRLVNLYHADIEIIDAVIRDYTRRAA